MKGNIMNKKRKWFIIIKGALFWDGKRFSYRHDHAILFPSYYAAKNVRTLWRLNSNELYNDSEIVELKGEHS